jgi:hypothetical protein
MVSTTARLHSDDAARNLADKINERLPPHRSANSYRTFVVDADNTAAIFAYIDTQIEIVMDRLLFLQLSGEMRN